MKPTLPILAGLLAVAAPLGAQNIKIDIDPNKSAQPAQQPAKPAPAAPAAEKVDIVAPVDGKYTDVQKMEVYGFIMANRLAPIQEAAAIMGSKEELLAFLEGIGEAMTGSRPRYDEKIVVPQTGEMVKQRMELLSAEIEKRRLAALEKNAKEAAAYLATLDTKPNVKKSSSGLRYEIIKEGSGSKAKPTQAVIASYKASLIDGTVFDTSETKQGKVEFALATAIPGLKEGLQLTGVGGKVKLYLTSDLGFGDSGQVLPPGILTIFEMDILEVKEPTKQPEEKK